ncbi:hypothetical protein GCM10007173_26130 [Glutamicibacter ardleyensis]|uniref:Transposase n=1 Tax=Glutamicibacter ardleyensis TaxID=225894 RepID=A0ABQ2DSQ4_9MICC|nr:hypothetical protein GCM10007173_26130 [Glutamicibacter ardleyensis]
MLTTALIVKKGQSQNWLTLMRSVLENILDKCVQDWLIYRRIRYAATHEKNAHAISVAQRLSCGTPAPTIRATQDDPE